MQIIHHGAINGVTGSCHQLIYNQDNNGDTGSILIDCGLFQGAEATGKSNVDLLAIDFDIGGIDALIITHCHIDHVGRIPYLLAAGFNRPIFTTKATAALLPLVIEDALKIGVTSNKRLISLYLKKLKQLLIPLDYNQWLELDTVHTGSNHQKSKNKITNKPRVKIRLQMAGHILGSAYVEVEIVNEQLPTTTQALTNTYRVVFSGDLGATYTPLLPSPQSPYRADTLVIESTYGDKNHQGRKKRSQTLKRVIELAVADMGVVLIPAFSIGRTQELLYELEQIIFQQRRKRKDNSKTISNNQRMWQQIEIIIDSPMAAKFTDSYRELSQYWDKEAKAKLTQHRHPLDFSQLYTVNSHQEHLATIDYLAKRNKPAIVIAASGMCNGGRIVNYLQRFLTEPTADVIFVGYQAKGTTGRELQELPADRDKTKESHIYIEGRKVEIKASIHTISGYSAHADQTNLINFVKRMRHKPKQIRLVHGDDEAKQALAQKYQELLPDCEVLIPINTKQHS